MKYKKRKFIPGECMHIYQRSVNGYIIFYDLEDFLVFYMVFSVFARIYKVRVLEMCIMPNHVHILLESECLDEISRFIMRYTSVFVREYNDAIGRRGPLFHKSFGSAPKKGGKNIRSTIVYIGNNPVEKDLSLSSEGYRWNFLAYIKLRGKKFPLRGLRYKLQKAFKFVDMIHSKSAFLTYHQLARLMQGLTPEEISKLSDYIIMKYYPFDTDALLSFYSSYEDMIQAMHCTSGKEYDIKEVYIPEPDTVYRKMSAVLEKTGFRNRYGLLRHVSVLSDDEKFNLAQMLRRQTNASLYQVCRFLHMEVKKR